MMKVTIAEGDCRKDSQDIYVRHAPKTVNLQVDARTTIQEQEEIIWEIENPKYMRRTDYKKRKSHFKKDKFKSKTYNIRPHSDVDYLGNLFTKLKSLDSDVSFEICETILMAILCKLRTSSIERVLLICLKLCRIHLGVKYSKILEHILEVKDFKSFRSIFGWTLEDLEKYFKELLLNWKIASKNEAFGSIISLISTVALILYGADKKWTISIGSFSLFMLDTKNACKGANGFIDAILKVVTYVMSGIKQFTTTGEFSAFLYADDQLAEFDAVVSKLKATMQLLQPGNLQRCANTDENKFDNELQLAISSGEKLISLYDGPTKKYVMDKVRLLRQIHVDFIQFRSAGGLRVAPYAYLLAGSTGLGKSSLNEILMRYILMENGFNHQDSYICTLNAQDKYFSTYRSYINGVIFDDFANTNSDFTEGSPCEVLLKFVNNVPFYLNMAELELKGKVVAEPKVIGVTTNVADIDSSVYSNQPSSIMRRLKVHIYAKVKKEFAKEGTIEIDPSKVHEKFGDSLAPDIWNFDVFTVKVDPIIRLPKLDNKDSTYHRDDNWHLEYVQWNGSDMKNANIKELLAYVKLATNTHYIEQHRLIERSKLFNGEIICGKCRLYHEHCTCVEDSGTYECDFAFLDEGGFTLEPIIRPHSILEGAYSDIIDLKQEELKVSLRDMLLAWVVEGRCNFEEYLGAFCKKFSDEAQYVLIILRKIFETWLNSNRARIVEFFLPSELDDTRIGDYMTVVARPNAYRALVNYSFFSHLLGCYSVASAAAVVGRYSLCGGLLVPCLGYKAFSYFNVPHKVIKAYEYFEPKFKCWYDFLDRHREEIYNISPFVVMLGLGRYFYPENRAIPLVSSSFFTSALFFKSFNYDRKYNAPRAISQFFKRNKPKVDVNWQRIAPASLALVATYLHKESIVDFYVDAWETWCTTPHSITKPKIADIEKRDKKHRFDENWFISQAEGFLDPLPTSKPRTPQEVRDAIADNVWYVTNLDNNAQSNCLVIHSGCILIPWHFVPKSVVKMKFKRHNRGNSGNSSFESVVDPQQCIRIKDYDLSLMWMPKTRDVKSLIDYFPTAFHESSVDRTGRVATRSPTGELEWGDVKEVNFTKHAQSGLGFVFNGIRYFWSGAVKGKCLSPIVTDDKGTCISGLHIGGSEEIRRSDKCYLAFGVTPTQSDLLEAKGILEKMATVVPMSSSGDFYPHNMGERTLQRCIKKKSCYLRVESDNSAYFFGSSYNCNRTPKSMVRDTPIKGMVKDLFHLDLDWGPPKFKGPDGKSPYIPWEVGMEKWIVDRPGLPFTLLNRAKTHYVNGLVRVLYENKTYWSNEIRVLTWDETVNGVPGKRFIDSMNFKSSIGFPFHGSKRKYSKSLGNTGEGWQDKRILNKEFIDEAIKIEELYKLGKRYYPWFVSTLKDEPTQTTKDKVRVFQATSTPFQLVMRKYTLGVCRFLQMNPLDSECAVGIDPCSNEWNEMYTHLQGVQTPLHDRWFAIDYKVYDSSISSQMILAVGRIFVDIARVAGYTDEDIAVLHSIFTELSFSVVDFNGDVLMLDGANPSGNSLTVFINNVCNSLLMRVFFYNLYPHSNFSDYVRMMAYGDDLIAVINAFARGFTMCGYATYLSQFGFIVTPADKDSVMRNFSKSWEVDFLKRKFTWSNDYGAVIAPLDEASIYKRLCNYMSSTTDVWVIVGANIDGALDEWAFYGKEVYEDRQKRLIQIVNEFELHRFVSRINFSYEQRVSYWKQQFAVPAVMGEGQSMDTNSPNCDRGESGFFGWGNIISKMGIGGPPLSHNSRSNSSVDLSSINEWTNETNHESQVKTNNSPTVGEQETQEWEVFPHSAFSMEKEQIMSMEDGSTNQVTNIPSFIDETRKVNDSSDNSLGEFLSRPIILESFDWTPSIGINFDIKPWKVFLDNKRVVNRIANYKLMRAKMKIKIMINGNSFFYGRLMVSYLPFSTLDSMSSLTPLSIDNVQCSQMPRVFIDPTTSQGGEMTLPFFWYYDYLEMLDFDSTKLGALLVRELTPLKHTSGDTSINSKVTVTIYGWMEDVQLEAPTHRNPIAIVPQSTTGNDEHTTETGPITKVATAIQAAATIGAMNPALAPFCTPAMWGAKMVAAGASAMGWSSPSLLEEPKFVEPRGTGSTTLANVPDTGGKLTLDAKQEITVDPRTVGLGPTDELDIRYIASRETWLTSFVWPLDSLREDLLFNLRADPCQFNTLSTEGADRLSIVASCGAALPFRYWNGTFKVRLQFVTSAFHRGRVAVVYDPYTTAAIREDNIAYTHIVDISSCRDVTFSVGPNQDRTLLKHCIPGFHPVSDMWRSSDPLNVEDFGNGTIAVYVLNELTIPSSDSAVDNDIKVNVFVSMGDDFETFVPGNDFIYYTIKPQSTGMDVSTPDAIEDSEAYSSDVFTLDMPNRVSNKRNLVYSGEQVRSFRMLLKRYYPWGAMAINPSSGLSAVGIQHRIFPAYRGAVTGAVHNSIAGDYNYFQMTLLNWLLPAFQGWRGSIRYKWFPRCVGNGDRGLTNAYVSFVDDAQYGYEDVSFNGASPSALAYSVVFCNNFEHKSTGALTFVQSVNPTIEYEIPWYTDYRFHPGKTIDWTTIETPEFDDGVTIGAQLYIDNVNASGGFYDIFVSAGEDFSCHYFTGWPPLYFEPNPPLPA